jgi:copper transport protein
VAALVLLTVAPSTAWAHAALLRTDPPDLCLLPGGESLPSDAAPCRAGAVLPGPPREVRLVFNEAVQPIGRGLRVIGPDGRRADRDALNVSGPELRVHIDARAAGTYRVVWSVVSSDTHPDLGTMTFSVRRPGGAIFEGAAGPSTAGGWGTALGTAAHLAHFAGFALGFGVPAAMWLGACPVVSFDGPGTPERVWRLIGAGTVLLLLAEPAAFVAESVSLGAVGRGADPAVLGALLDSSFGRVASQRLAAAILLWVLAGALRTGALRAPWALPALGVALAFADGQAAHAAAVRPPWWGFAVNAAHVSAMGLWAGMLAFVLSVPGAGAWRSSRVHGRIAAAASAAAVTGIVMAGEHLSALRDLVTNSYGRTLGVKTVLAAAVAALGWLAARHRERRAYAWEAAAMVAVLALAGLLILQRPPVP